MGYSVAERGHGMDRGRLPGKSVLVGKGQGCLGKTRAGVPYSAIRSSLSHHTSLSLSFPVCIMGIELIFLRVVSGLSEIKK